MGPLLQLPFRCGEVMNFNTQRKLLVQYSNLSRATLLPSTFTPSRSMPRAQRKKTKMVKRAKVRVVKGHLTLKVAGYPGLHRFGASQLIQFVPLNKIRVAAKKILVQSRVAKPKRKRSVKQKQRKNNRHVRP
jgi:hypothetical protein